MREVHVGHDPVVIANHCLGHIARRADVEGAKLPYGVSVSDDQFARLTGVLFVLRYSTQGVELEDAIVLADGGVPLNDAMAGYVGACINLHMRANDGVGPYPDTAVKLGCWIDNGGWMNERHRLLKQAN